MSIFDEILMIGGVGLACVIGGITWFLFRCYRADQDSAARCAGETPDEVTYTYDTLGQYSRGATGMEEAGWVIKQVIPRKTPSDVITVVFKRKGSK